VCKTCPAAPVRLAAALCICVIFLVHNLLWFNFLDPTNDVSNTFGSFGFQSFTTLVTPFPITDLN
jgi:hypothetical protein